MAKVRSRDKRCLQIDAAADIQPDIPVQSSEGKVIDYKSEGWNGTVFRGIQTNGYHVIGFLQMFSDFGTECSITGTVFRDFDPVYEHFCNMSSAVKLQEYSLAVQICGKNQDLAVPADHFVVGRRGVMQRAFPDRMGKTDDSARSTALHKIFRPGRGEFPVVVDSNHSAEVPFSLLIRYYHIFLSLWEKVVN